MFIFQRQWFVLSVIFFSFWFGYARPAHADLSPDFDLANEALFFDQANNQLIVTIINNGAALPADVPNFAVRVGWNWDQAAYDENGLPPILDFITQEKELYPVRNWPQGVWKLEIPYPFERGVPPQGATGLIVEIDVDNVALETNEGNNLSVYDLTGFELAEAEQLPNAVASLPSLRYEGIRQDLSQLSFIQNRPNFVIQNFAYRQVRQDRANVSFEVVDEQRLYTGEINPRGGVYVVRRGERQPYDIEELAVDYLIRQEGNPLRWTFDFDLLLPLPENVVGLAAGVNIDARISENNENDNLHFYFLRPDLSTRSAVILPEAQTIEIYNFHHAAAPVADDFQVAFGWEVPGQETVLERGRPARVPGQPGMWRVGFQVPQPEGAVTYVIHVDSLNEVDESYEGNNELRNSAPGRQIHELASFDREQFEGESSYDPRILPDSPWYALKQFVRSARLAMTFSEEKKVSVHLQHLHKMRQEAKELIQKEKQEDAVKHAERISEKTKQVYDVMVKTNGGANHTQRSEAMKEFVAAHVLMESLESFGSRDILNSAKKDIETAMVQTLSNLDEETFTGVMDSVFAVEKKSVLAPLHELGVLAMLETHAQDTTKALIAKKKSRTQEQFARILASAPEQVHLAVPEYVQEIAADDVRQITVLAELAQKVDNPRAKQALGSAVARMVEKVQDRIEEGSQQGYASDRLIKLEGRTVEEKTEAFSQEDTQKETERTSTTSEREQPLISEDTKRVQEPITRPEPPKETPVSPVEPIKVIEPIRIVPPVDICTKEYVPVCGDNGTTYGNECEAKKAGVRVEHSGVCTSAPIIITPPVIEVPTVDPTPTTIEVPKEEQKISSAPGNVSIVIKHFGFEATSPNVRPGGMITFTNLDNDDVHAIVGDLATGVMKLGQSISIDAPKTPGTYKFYSSNKKEMVGRIVVE